MQTKYNKCPICGKLYEYQNMTVRAQDVCVACDNMREKMAREEDTDENIKRRREYFGK